MNRMKYLMFIAFLFLIGCANNNKEISGTYYNLSEKRLYKFDEKDVFIYSLIDSFSSQYKYRIDKNELILRNKNERIKYYYVFENDTVWLIDNGYSKDIILKKIPYSKKKFNSNIFFDRFWKFRNENIEYVIKFNQFDADLGYGELYEIHNEGKHIYLNTNFGYAKRNFFNEFNIFQIESRLIRDSNYIVLNQNNNSIQLIGLNNLEFIQMESLKSEIDKNIFGLWKKSDFNQEYSFFNYENKIILNDSIYIKNSQGILNKTFEIDGIKYRSLDNLEKDNSLDKNLLRNKFGFNTSYLLIENPVRVNLKIKELSEKSLILYHESDKLKVFKYKR